MSTPIPTIGVRPRSIEHRLEILTEPTYVKDIVKGLLHTIFFHRLFPTLRPLTRDVVFPPAPSPTPISSAYPPRPSSPPNSIVITLPVIDDADLESLITDRAATVARRLQGDRSIEKRATLWVYFYEKKRKKAATGFAGLWGAAGSNDGGDVRWETWRLEVRCSSASGDLAGQRCAKSFRAAAMDILMYTGEEKAHIPPITTADTNPFPYEIVVATAPGK